MFVLFVCLFVLFVCLFVCCDIIAADQVHAKTPQAFSLQSKTGSREGMGTKVVQSFEQVERSNSQDKLETVY